MIDKHFTKFNSSVDTDWIPKKLNDPFKTEQSKITLLAVEELQKYLKGHQDKWKHNFGLSQNKCGPVKGKMFGVLVVETQNRELGFLSGFSGRFADDSYPDLFVPSLFDVSTDDYFINSGMTSLSLLNLKINALHPTENAQEMVRLKKRRKEHSEALQDKLFKSYNFLNGSGELKNVTQIFFAFNGRKPPSGAGECAAPKLLHYAFKHKMTPLAIAEFWWEKTSKTNTKQHKQFYPSCEDKCRPILNYMLEARVG